MTARHWLALAGVVVAYLLLGAGFALRTPVWQNPDEPAHYNYVWSLATGHGLPILQPGAWDSARLRALTAARFPADAAIDWMLYEAHQPPLYYALLAPVLALAAGLPLASQVHLLRLCSLLLGAIGVVAAGAIGHALFPKRPWLAVAVPAFLVAVPQHVAVAASINNDVLAIAIFTLILLVLLRADRPGERASAGLPWRQRLVLGGLLGLALLTKTTIYAAVVLIPVGLARRAGPPADVAHGPAGRSAALAALASRFARVRVDLAAINGLALALAGWWFIRNALVYGGLDIFGWQRHDAIVVGQPRTVLDPAALVNFVVVTFQSFWAQLGWMAVPAQPADYLALGAIVGIAGVGLLSAWWQLDGRQRGDFALLGVALLLVVGQLGWYNLTFIQPQGRYLFPAIAAIAVFVVQGLAAVLETPRLRPLALALVVVAALFASWQVQVTFPDARPVRLGLTGAIGVLALASLATLAGWRRRSWAPVLLLVAAFAAFDLAALIHLVSFL